MVLCSSHYRKELAFVKHFDSPNFAATMAANIKYVVWFLRMYCNFVYGSRHRSLV